MVKVKAKANKYKPGVKVKDRLYEFTISNYEPELCIELIEMFSEGKTMYEFCAKHNIADKAFYKWCNNHPEFDEAYEVAKIKARAYYEEFGRRFLSENYESDKLNNAQFNRIMGARFNVNADKRIRIKGIDKAKTIEDKINVVLDQLSDGTVTTKETLAIAKVLETAVKISQHSELEDRLKAIEDAQKVGADDADFKEVNLIEE